ncbi:MAG TPA: AbrB/MazE/SpoVT family DNA-binding domain-containing protein [archaeon]|nr:AbrB/MazE/SpoVT family DNA-binding domain-containing protein [archaeon]
MYEAKFSSKGQVVVPAKIRKRAGFGKGRKVIFQETPWGVMMVLVPKDPLKALIGMTKGLGVKSSDIKKMRQEDDKIAFKNL